MKKRSYYGVFLLLIPLINLVYVSLKEKKLAVFSLISFLVIISFIIVEFLKLRKSRK
ncbi:hypothetical protein J2X75_003825 [Paenibacillus sp. 2003]|nr:hypothetical protein [Paenibacillus sp. 2003]